MTYVVRLFTFSISPGQTVGWWGWWGYPNANPDVFLDWLPRPVYPPGHQGHPEHRLKLVNVQVEKDPNNQSGFLYSGLIQSTGTHFTDAEMLLQVTTI